MKYILILMLLFTGCLEAPTFDKPTIITSVEAEYDRCWYKTTTGRFTDTCGKFNIGDTVITKKK